LTPIFARGRKKDFAWHVRYVKKGHPLKSSFLGGPIKKAEEKIGDKPSFLGKALSNLMGSYMKGSYVKRGVSS